MKTLVGEASSSGKGLVVGAGQESTIAGQAGPRSAQLSGPPMDSPEILDDSNANVGGVHNISRVIAARFLLTGDLFSTVELLDAQSQQ